MCFTQLKTKLPIFKSTVIVNIMSCYSTGRVPSDFSANIFSANNILAQKSAICNLQGNIGPQGLTIVIGAVYLI